MFLTTLKSIKQNIITNLFLNNKITFNCFNSDTDVSLFDTHLKLSSQCGIINYNVQDNCIVGKKKSAHTLVSK